MSKKRCEVLAARLGAKIHDWDDLRLEAPHARTFDGLVHEQVYAYDDGDKAGAWKDMLEDLRYFDRMGDFINCDKKINELEECEWCDPTWTEAEMAEANRSAAENAAKIWNQIRQAQAAKASN